MKVAEVGAEALVSSKLKGSRGRISRIFVSLIRTGSGTAQVCSVCDDGEEVVSHGRSFRERRQREAQSHTSQDGKHGALRVCTTMAFFAKGVEIALVTNPGMMWQARVYEGGRSGIHWCGRKQNHCVQYIYRFEEVYKMPSMANNPNSPEYSSSASRVHVLQGVWVQKETVVLISPVSNTHHTS